jgi:hypothetical protein
MSISRNHAEWLSLLEVSGPPSQVQYNRNVGALQVRWLSFPLDLNLVSYAYFR